MKRKHWIALLSIALALLVAGGSVTAWLLTRTPPDTDPNAPFEDLSQWEKRQAKKAVEDYWQTEPVPHPLFWYGEQDDHYGTIYQMRKYALRYYGTFSGYDIIVSPYPTVIPVSGEIEVGGYVFRRHFAFQILACKHGKAISLNEAYEEGALSEEQIGRIYQCFEYYDEEIYQFNGEDQYAQQNEKSSAPLYVCCGIALFGGCGLVVFCVCRRRKTREDIQFRDNGT